MDSNLFLTFTKPSIWRKIVQKQHILTEPLVLLRLLFHATVTVHHMCVSLYSLKIDTTGVTDRVTRDIVVYFPLYFTTWNFVLQMAYFGTAAVFDVLIILSILPNVQKKLYKYNQYVYPAMVFPYGIYVFSMYWGLYYLDPDYVTSSVSRAFLPKWFDHSVHTWILAVVIVEFWIQLYPSITLKRALQGQGVIFLLYHIVLITSRFFKGYWIYPVFNLFTFFQLVTFMTLYNLYICGVTLLGLVINKLRYKCIQKKVDLTKQT